MAPGLLPGARVLDAVLAAVKSSTQISLNGKTVWVVSLMSADGTFPDAHGKPTKVAYALAFIDPRSGHFLGSFTAGSW
jgi:hypothetical protein